MQISVNGEQMDVAEGITAEKLISDLGLADKRIAMELNQNVIPRSQYADTAIQSADVVEIVHAIGGG